MHFNHQVIMACVLLFNHKAMMREDDEDDDDEDVNNIAVVDELNIDPDEEALAVAGRDNLRLAEGRRLRANILERYV